MPQYISKLVLNGVTQMDVTQDTVAASNLLSGETATGADGAPVTGSIASKTSSDVTVSGNTVTVPAGHYASQVTKSVASGTAGTPTATKGTVSNHSVSVTPSVTNTTGYITGSTKTGTAVTVSASELVSGTKTITDNGTGIDVTNYANVDVNVSGGGGGSAEPKDVNFIDYDGTILYSYTKAEALALDALPSNPSHSGLTSQGWNYTLAQIKTECNSVGKCTVGQMYVTQSGDTEIDVRFVDAARLSPYISFAVNGTVEIDWGDNSAKDTVTGTSLTSRKKTQHIYSSTGDYTIKIHVVSGTWNFYGTSTYTLLNKDNSTAGANRVYSNCVQSIRIGSNTGIGEYAFYYLGTITITTPSSVTNMPNYAYGYSMSHASITIPSGVTSIGNYAFANLYALKSITMPSGVTSIGNYAFYDSYNIESIAIPSSVTSIGNYAFQYCMLLASITIPSGVTSIGTGAFSGCYGVAEYHLKPTSPPSLANINAFTNIQSECKIYVPSASLDTYKTASNWSSYASYMVGE